MISNINLPTNIRWKIDVSCDDCRYLAKCKVTETYKLTGAILNVAYCVGELNVLLMEANNRENDAMLR